MRNLLGNERTQLPRNEEIIRCSNQQRRVSDTPQSLSFICSFPTVVLEKPSPGRRLSQEEAKRLLAKFA